MSDQIKLRCPSCKHGLKASTDAAGKRCKCTRCSEIFKIPVLELLLSQANDAWYYLHQESYPQGPFTTFEMRSFLQNQHISEDTYVRTKDSDPWVSAKHVDFSGEASSLKTTSRKDFFSMTEKEKQQSQQRVREVWEREQTQELKVARQREKLKRSDKPTDAETIKVIGGTFVFLVIGAIFLYSVTQSNSPEDKNSTGSRRTVEVPDFDVEEAVETVIEETMSTAQGRMDVLSAEAKDLILTRFQRQNGISDRIVEASIKEWVATNWKAGRGLENFDYDLEEVTAICLRNKRNGIPHRYIPESEK